MRKMCLVSIIASHYRSSIYQLMDKRLQCDFIFGEERNSVKRMDTSLLRHVKMLRNRHILGTPAYFQTGLLCATRGYSTVISDLGIFCLSSWLLLLIARFRGQRVLLWDHGWYGRESFIKKWLKRTYYGLANGALLYGNRALRLMTTNGFHVRNFHVIHNSLNYKAQLELRHKMKPSTIYLEHFGNTAPVVVMIGRLNAVKRTDMIISAAARLNKQDKKINVVIIGDGEEREMLEQQARTCGIKERVWFAGAIYDETRNAELLLNADLCAVPGPVGLTAIHAMMFGVPVISNDNFACQMPEHEAIHDGQTGCFFRDGDTESLANEISKWLEKKSEKREEVRQACYKEIDTSWTPEFQLSAIKEALL